MLAKLSGEAWKATEHLKISGLRKADGWLSVIKALGSHYRFLPETELHEAIEEFLFLLKRRPHEGATSFSSRFKTQLDRVQSPIAQERESTRKKRRNVPASLPDHNLKPAVWKRPIRVKSESVSVSESRTSL